MLLRLAFWVFRLDQLGVNRVPDDPRGYRIILFGNLESLPQCRVRHSLVGNIKKATVLVAGAHLILSKPAWPLRQVVALRVFDAACHVPASQ